MNSSINGPSFGSQNHHCKTAKQLKKKFKMAASLRPLFLAIIPLLMVSSSIRSSEGSDIGFYWGRSPNDGNLAEICSGGVYEYVALAFLDMNGSQPFLSLDHHCGPNIARDCGYLGPQIDVCRAKGIKVLLSLSGRPVLSASDAHNVAKHLWDNYLGDNSSSGPLNATLDGIDFRIQSGSNENLDVLAKAIASYSTDERKVYLSAAPLCDLPDFYLDAALKTGVFDYVWVQFFGHPSCSFVPGIARPFPLGVSYIEWNCFLAEYSPSTQIFLGLTNNTNADGFIRCSALTGSIDPWMGYFPKYGGMMMLDGEYYCSDVSSDVLAYDRKSMNKFRAIG